MPRCFTAFYQRLDYPVYAMPTRHEDAGGGPDEDGEVVFVVRVRLPASAGGAPEIYGRAEHLKSQSSCYFKDCAALCEFMYSALGKDGT